jgi:hypothetical protein
MLGGALGRPTLHDCAFPGVAGQRCRLEKVLPGTTMLPGAAEQVAGDRRQQVVLAKLGDVEQGSTMSSPACGPNACAIATPPFSSTTGEGLI